jgi:ubiquinone/menaquinone biosynthesis C-methylase UbiE
MKVAARSVKGHRGLAMEGPFARWYADQRRRGGQIDEWRAQAAHITEGLPEGSRIFEVAPGPGYFAIELARLGRYRVTGLDISHTFVELASRHAREAGLQVEFRQGDASQMPFGDGSFDLIVCQSAFKNFSRPVQALDEMHRVLRPGGTAVIQDMNRRASNAAIEREMSKMGLSPMNAFLTRWTFRLVLRRRAYTREQFERMAAQSDFGGCEVRAEGIGLEVRVTKV